MPNKIILLCLPGAGQLAARQSLTFHFPSSLEGDVDMLQMHAGSVG